MRKKMEKDTGVWKKGSWDHLIDFTSLGDLAGQLKRLNALQIDKLGIVAHGNQPGLVLLDRDLTPESAPSFNSEFSALSLVRRDGTWFRWGRATEALANRDAPRLAQAISTLGP